MPKEESGVVFVVRIPKKQQLSYEHLPLGSRIFREGEFQPDHSDSVVPLMPEEIDDSTIRKVEIKPFINIRKIISGKSHSNILTMDGLVLSFGCNYFGELCCGFCGPLLFKEEPIDLCRQKQGEDGSGNRIIHRGMIQAVGPISKTKIIDGACGVNHSIFLSEDSRIFVNGKFQMKYITSNNNSLDDACVPMEVDQENCFGGKKQIISVAACGSSSVVLTANGEVYKSSAMPVDDLHSWYRVIIQDCVFSPVKLFSFFLSTFTSMLCENGQVYTISDMESQFNNDVSNVEYVIPGYYSNVIFKLRNGRFFSYRNNRWIDFATLLGTEDELISIEFCANSTVIMYTQFGKCLYCDDFKTVHDLSTLEFSNQGCSHVRISASRYRSYIYNVPLYHASPLIQKSFPCFWTLCFHATAEGNQGIIVLSDIFIKTMT
ncbi:hypothetical protein FDP41_006218 [Naegleria fowleri]|uniref:Uncharacterized protein n=1 Tax=Naegleria fowleri TaxID=5763 RepID=A0A6A5BL16_NAEFO|nr:uncharacterized protein FDP41_006218 [Naegleria fowleri]KAF0974744.1 hypothetical protein FDP41_006218 [Naegleria fowleri]CAG4716781.1 unnamed protein product [Naegleria fowleri]